MLAPWAHAVHIKDQAVQLTSSGFLFGDIPLGQGFIDLKKIVAILKAARPHIHFTLELLTRDPLSVPCLEPKYWTTFPDLPARELRGHCDGARSRGEAVAIPLASVS